MKVFRLHLLHRLSSTSLCILYTSESHPFFTQASEGIVVDPWKILNAILVIPDRVLVDTWEYVDDHWSSLCKAEIAYKALEYYPMNIRARLYRSDWNTRRKASKIRAPPYSPNTWAELAHFSARDSSCEYFRTHWGDFLIQSWKLRYGPICGVLRGQIGG